MASLIPPIRGALKPLDGYLDRWVGRSRRPRVAREPVSYAEATVALCLRQVCNHRHLDEETAEPSGWRRILAPLPEVRKSAAAAGREWRLTPIGIRGFAVITAIIGIALARLPFEAAVWNVAIELWGIAGAGIIVWWVLEHHSESVQRRVWLRQNTELAVRAMRDIADAAGRAIISALTLACWPDERPAELSRRNSDIMGHAGPAQQAKVAGVLEAKCSELVRAQRARTTNIDLSAVLAALTAEWKSLAKAHLDLDARSLEMADVLIRTPELQEHLILFRRVSMDVQEIAEAHARAGADKDNREQASPVAVSEQLMPSLGLQIAKQAYRVLRACADVRRELERLRGY